MGHRRRGGYGGAAGLRQYRARRQRDRRRRDLSMAAFEGGVPATLPLAARLPSVPLARRRLRRGGERHWARLFLSRLLLDAACAPVRRRAHEPRLDRPHPAAAADRGDPALGPAYYTT